MLVYDARFGHKLPREGSVARGSDTDTSTVVFVVDEELLTLDTRLEKNLIGCQLVYLISVLKGS